MPSSLNGTGVTFNDATTLQTGIIPAGNLASNSVTAVKIADANVTTAKLATNERMTTGNVLSVTAGASGSAVGSYSLLGRKTLNSTSHNQNIAGSNLAFASLAFDTTGRNAIIASGTLAGTWKCMSVAPVSAGDRRGGTLFLRIS